VLDIKDNWELFVPRGLRRLMAWRTRGWAAVTANARFTAEKARLWQEVEATVIYSGVDEAFFEREPDIEEGGKAFCINLVGGIYFREYLKSFLMGVGAWAESLSPEQRSSIVVRYLGVDGRLVGEVARRCLPKIEIAIMGYLAVDRMAHYCRSAALNAYIAHSGTFHHKLLELLACGRPVMACPVESEESRDLARQASGVLLEVSDSAQVSSELTKLHRAWRSESLHPASPDAVRCYSWGDQARVLEQALADVVSLS
jgi:glycosyltransferase involved in cell wall biosynthesis